MRVLGILVLMFGLAIFVNAQTAILSGTVYDPIGAVIPGTKVTAINQKLEKFETFTNYEGEYKMNLPYNKYDSAKSESQRIAKYTIIVEATNFEIFLMKDFNFVPSFAGKMQLDFAVDLPKNENCGAGGCIEQIPPQPPQEAKISKDIIEKPLIILPKVQNKTKKKKNEN